MKKKWVINIDDIPADSTVEKFILHNTDIQKQIKHFEKKYQSDYLSLPIDFQLKELKQELAESIANSGTFAFKYEGRTSNYESYQSVALTWNPNAIDRLSDNPHQSALGSSKYSDGNSSFYESHGADKNTYADTYSFNQRTPISQSGHLKLLLDNFKRSLIRSRISIIKAQQPETQDIKYLWHKDESIFINLRVNIPIQSNENYVIQFLDDKNSFEPLISEFVLEADMAYIYNTQKLHRPYCKKLNDLDRINIICGVSPWFDYHHENHQWVSNEFYGEIHPYEMFLKGHISKSIGRL